MIASPNKKFEKYRQFTMNLLKQQSIPAAKTTTKTERLVGGSYSASIFWFTNTYDSVLYRYSSKSRGSQFDLNNLAYTFPQTAFDYQEPMTAAVLYGTPQVDVLCDTFYGANYDTTAILRLANTTYASYDVNNNLVNYTTNYADTTYTKDLRYYNAYNAAGDITVNLTFAPGSGGKWDSTYKRIFGYNASNQLITDSIYSYNGTGWDPLTAYIYSYDGGGHMTNVNGYGWADTAWAGNLKYNMTYYPSGKLQAMTASFDTGTGFYIAYIDSLGYTTGANYFTYFRAQQVTDTGMQTTYTFTKHIGANGLPDSALKVQLIYFYSGTGVMPVNVYFKESYIYDSLNNPIENDEYIKAAGLVPDYAYNASQYYWYASPDTDTTTEIKNVTVQHDVEIYPNPAQNRVYITLNDVTSNKNMVVSLTNAAGRLLSTENIPWSNKTEQVSVAGLAPGVYFLSIADATGNMWRTQRLIKQ